MRLITPQPDEPELLDWWRPLLAFARAARAAGVSWPVDIDDFCFAGQCVRSRGPVLSAYEHARSGGWLFVDDDGRPHKFTEHRSGGTVGRFTPIDVRAAVLQAELPRDGHGIERGVGVEHGVERAAATHGHPAAPRVAASAARPECSPRRRGHLRLVEPAS